MGQLQSTLMSDDGPTSGIVWLIRMVDLAAVNRNLGHRLTDQLLQRLAKAIEEATKGIPGVLIGRLNGGDFAVSLNDGLTPLPQPEYMADVLKRLFSEEGVHAQAVIGAARWKRGAEMAQILASADSALARAESKGNFCVELSDVSRGSGEVLGEGQWRERLSSALDERRVKLGSFPLIDPQGALVHNECPMRLQLMPGGDFESAAVWLPMALRCGLISQLDELAVATALAEIAKDGVERGVNLSPASLQDIQFVHRLHARLLAAPEAARHLWLEVAEMAALDNFAMVRELCKQVKALGVRVGLEHAGERLTRIEFLFEAGLDYVKLDASVVHGVASDSARRAFVAGSVTMLHSLGLAVYAEGVHDLEDLQALWPCGLNGVTGPAVRFNAP